MTQPNKPVSQRAELKPCPICKGPAQYHRPAVNRVGIRCADLHCGTQQRLCFDEDEAVRLWNIRPAETNASLSSEAEAEVRAKILALEDFINEPPRIYDIEPMEVRDYRHQAYRVWAPVRDAFLRRLASTPSQSDVIEKCGEALDRVTIEQCASVPKEMAQQWARSASDHNYDRIRQSAAMEIEAAIRALASKEGQL